MGALLAFTFLILAVAHQIALAKTSGMLVLGLLPFHFASLVAIAVAGPTTVEVELVEFPIPLSFDFTGELTVAGPIIIAAIGLTVELTVVVVPTVATQEPTMESVVAIPIAVVVGLTDESAIAIPIAITVELAERFVKAVAIVATQELARKFTEVIPIASHAS